MAIIANKSKYDTHIKPQFKKIKELKLKGALDRDIYTALGVSSSVWYKHKQENKELSEFLNNITTEKQDEEIDKVKEAITDKPPLDYFVNGIKKQLDKDMKNGDVSVATLIKVANWLYPFMNPYLLNEREKTDILRYDAETRRIQTEKTQTNVLGTVINNEMVEMIIGEAPKLDSFNQNKRGKGNARKS